MRATCLTWFYHGFSQRRKKVEQAVSNKQTTRRRKVSLSALRTVGLWNHALERLIHTSEKAEFQRSRLSGLQILRSLRAELGLGEMLSMLVINKKTSWRVIMCC